jgi:hypothetical protein
MEKMGGRKFFMALLVTVVVLAVFVILALKGTLGEGLCVTLGGWVTAVLAQFGFFNTANTKAALAAKGAANAETTRLNGLSDSGVLAAACATEAVRSTVDGASELMRGTVNAARAAVSGAANEGRERLRGAATAGV